MKVDGGYGSLLQGVSQQPATTRQEGQCTLQDNMSSNPVKSLTRRPSTNYIKSLFAGTNAQFYSFKIDSVQYMLAATVGGIKVFNESNGTEKTVTSSGLGYLDGNKLAFTDLQGTVYIANTNTGVSMLGNVPSYVQTGAIVYCVGGQYGRTYTINIAWSGTAQTVSWTAPDGSSAAHTAQITTTNIMYQLTALLVANSTINTNFDITRVDDVLYISKKTAPLTEDFTVATSDGESGTTLLVVNNQIKDASKLPRYAPQGYVIEILGNATAKEDNWYVQYVIAGDSSGAAPAMGGGFGRSGTWQECVAPDIPFKFDTATMPHILSYDVDTDTFTFAVGSWADRGVGDLNTAPDPSFVGYSISGLSYMQGRLVILSGPNVFMTRTNRPLDCWPKSATTEVDTDPIDIQSTSAGVDTMVGAIPFNRDLVVFAEKAQFIVFGRNALTPSNASLVETTKFEADLGALPVSSGKNIFFGIKFGKYGGVREFYADSNVDQNDARPITDHCNKYIKGNINLIAASTNFGLAVYRASDDSKVLYAYEYLWVDTKKLQSSWSRWTFPHPVEYVSFDQSIMHIVLNVNGTYTLLSMDIEGRDTFNLTYQPCLDMIQEVSMVSKQITLPAGYDINTCVFIQGDNGANVGLRLEVQDYNVSTRVVTFSGTQTNIKVVYGTRFTSNYMPTMPYIKDSAGVAVTTGTLTVSSFIVSYNQSGVFYSVRKSKHRDDLIIEHSPIKVGDPNFNIGYPPILDGETKVGFAAKVDEAEVMFTTDSHLPFTVAALEWQGQYRKLGKRISAGGK
jgi:hypothetical protein